MIVKSPKSNGTVVKTVVREVVKEELAVFGDKLRKELKEENQSFQKEVKEENRNFRKELREQLREDNELLFARYRDEVTTKLDEAVGRLKKTQEEQAVHAGQHEEINQRLDALEEIHPHGTHA